MWALSEFIVLYRLQKCKQRRWYFTSTSRNTSRISGFFLEFLPRVLPRTVRLRALTRSFTASAWCFGSRERIGASSDVGCSRPFIIARQFMVAAECEFILMQKMYKETLCQTRREQLHTKQSIVSFKYATMMSTAIHINISDIYWRNEARILVAARERSAKSSCKRALGNNSRQAARSCQDMLLAHNWYENRLTHRRLRWI